MTNEPAPLTTGQRIKAARIEKGLTQAQLCALVPRLTQANLSLYERDKQAPGENLNRIMQALGTSRILAAEDGALGIQGRAQGKLIAIDIMAEPIPVDWIVEGFVARGFLTMIAGQPGAGKSMTTQTVAEALVIGKNDVLGMKLRHRYAESKCITCDGSGEVAIGDPGDPRRCEECQGDGTVERLDSRVMVLDAENAPNIVQQRAQDMGLTEEEAPRYIAAASDGFDIYKDRASLDAMLADYRDAGTPIDLLVIDSWTSMWFGNENVVEQVQGCLKYLNELANRFKLGILLIHHTDKDGDDYRGSSAIAATIGGGVFAFSRFKDNDGEDHTARRLVCTKMRIAAEPTFPTLYITSHGVDTEPETSIDRIALAVAERDAVKGSAWPREPEHMGR